MIVEMEYKVVVAPTSTLEEAIEFGKQNGDVGTIYLSVPPFLQEPLKDQTEWPIIYTQILPQEIG